MTDRITVTGLRVFGRHGAFEHERRDGQEFRVDITAWLDLGAAAVSDDLADTLDYGSLAEQAAQIIGGESCCLIETVASRIADAILRDGKVTAIEVTVHKPSAPLPLYIADVAVTVHRGRAGAEP